MLKNNKWCKEVGNKDLKLETAHPQKNRMPVTKSKLTPKEKKKPRLHF